MLRKRFTRFSRERKPRDRYSRNYPTSDQEFCPWNYDFQFRGRKNAPRGWTPGLCNLMSELSLDRVVTDGSDEPGVGRSRWSGRGALFRLALGLVRLIERLCRLCLTYLR